MSFPAGEYVVSSGLTLPSGISLVGGPGATIAFKDYGTTGISFITLSGNNNIRNLEFTNDIPVGSASGQLFVFAVGASNIRIDSVNVDLGVIESGGALNSSHHLFGLPESGANDDVQITNSTFTAFKFGINKTNTSAATAKHWRYTGNRFHDFYSCALTFNTPAGDWDDIIVEGNHFENNLAADIGAASFDHMAGIAGSAGASGAVFKGNTFTGQGSALHFEEGASEVVIDSNVIKVHAAAAETVHGIEVLDNDVSGGAITPKRFIISKNIIVITSGTGRGIDLTSDASGVAPAHDFQVKDNTIDGAAIGINVAEDNERNVVRGNMLLNCTTGIRASRNMAGVDGNVFQNCTTAISSTGTGGLVGSVDAKDVTTLLTTSNDAIGLTRLTLRWDRMTLATGATAFDVFPAASTDRLAGKLSIYLSCNGAGASHRVAVYDISWDGSTLTGATAVVTAGGGSVTVTSLAVSAAILQWTVSNGAGAEDTQTELYMTFDGAYFVQA